VTIRTRFTLFKLLAIFVTDEVPQDCAPATRLLDKETPSLSPDEKRLYLLKEKARLLDELAKLTLHPG